MADRDEASLLVISRHSPYGGGLARAALDTVLATSAFDQPVSLLCSGDGVLQILVDQDTRAIGTRNHRQVLDSLELYDIENIYVEAAALEARGLAAEVIPPGCVVVSTEEIRGLIESHRHIMSF